MIREHTLQRPPSFLVVGDREMENHTVAVRTRGGDDLGSMPLDALFPRLESEVARHT